MTHLEQGGDFSKGNGMLIHPQHFSEYWSVFSFNAKSVFDFYIYSQIFEEHPFNNCFAGTGGESIYGGKFSGKVFL